MKKLGITLVVTAGVFTYLCRIGYKGRVRHEVQNGPFSEFTSTDVGAQVDHLGWKTVLNPF